MHTKQDIVPVKLTDEPKAPNNRTLHQKASPSKLVARVKFSQTDLFLYEDIKEETLRIFLLELNVHGNH